MSHLKHAEAKSNEGPAFGGLAWLPDPASPSRFAELKLGNYLFCFILLLLLFATNRSPDQSLIEFAGMDSYSYIAIAQAFPHLPSSALRIPFHHAQREAIPYLVGAISWLTNLSVGTCFFVVVLFLILAIVFLFARLLSELSLPTSGINLLLLFFVLSPYTFRFYIALPFVLTDLSFQLGLVIVALGLFKQRPWVTFSGFLLASLSRQTALLIIPLILGWAYLVWPAAKPFGSKLRKAVFSIAVLAVGILVYKGAGKLAAEYAQPNINEAHLVGLLNWTSTSFSLKELSVFLFRALVPFVIPVCFVLALVFRYSPRKWPGPERTKVFLLLGSVILICSQPILGGPIITGANLPRLNNLAIVPLLIAIGVILKWLNVEEELFDRVFPYACLFASVGSFHHVFSYLGGSNSQRAGQFTMVSFLLGAMLFFIVLYFTGKVLPSKLESDLVELQGNRESVCAIEP